MAMLAALVLVSTLATASAASPPDGPAAESAESVEAPVLTPRQARAERHRRRMDTIHTVAGVGMEIGAGLLHVLTATTFIDEELRCGGNAAAPECHNGTPVIVFLPAGAIGLGWAGATRLAAGREASIWRSPLFWVGTAVTIATIPVAVGLDRAFGSSLNSRNEGVATISALVAGFVIGNVIQVWGAYTAPPRDAPAATRRMSVAPGCAPTSGGVVCGLALANF
jgi:hypothetical protein